MLESERYKFDVKYEQMKKIIGPPIKYLDKIILNSKKFNVTDTIVVAGAPRSGTTWLMEILGTLPKYIYLFEPLNPRFFPESFEVGFQSRTYYPPNANWLEGEKYLKKTFTGRIFSSQSLARAGLQSLVQLAPKVIMRQLLGNKLIIKFITINRLLPWVAKRFKLRGLIFIIRHPCAVIVSQLKTGLCGYHTAAPPYIDIFPNRKNILDEASKIDTLDDRLLNRLNRIETREEVLAAAWCLDNYIPLSLPKPHPWTTVIYEKIFKEGEKEVIRLFNEIGEKNIPQAAIQHLNVPSTTSLGILKDEATKKIIRNADEQLSKWKKYLSEKQIERILKIVSAFGLDFYTEDIEPDYNNIHITVKN